MSSLAVVARALGATVTGSDQERSSYFEEMKNYGILVTAGHFRESVPPNCTLVYSSAIPDSNVERIEGRRLGVQEIRRGDLLAELANAKRTIAIAGTHGKTTTAAMVVHVMHCVGRPVNYIIGARLLGTHMNAEWVDDDAWLVVETDESDRSIEGLHPHIGTLTSVDHDHVKTFSTLADVGQIYSEFLSRSTWAIVPAEAPTSLLLDREKTVFGVESLSSNANGSTFRWRGITVSLSLLGQHNALDAVAALETCRMAGVAAREAARAVSTFPGVERRLQRLGRTASGAVIYSDYAHHPTEIRAGLTALRALPGSTLVVVFEPWGLTRTRAFADDFGESLTAADHVVLLPHVGSTVGESVADEGTALVVESLRRHGRSEQVVAASGYDAAVTVLQDVLSSESVCVVMGCGPVHQLAQRLVHPTGSA